MEHRWLILLAPVERRNIVSGEGCMICRVGRKRRKLFYGIKICTTGYGDCHQRNGEYAKENSSYMNGTRHVEVPVPGCKFVHRAITRRFIAARAIQLIISSGKCAADAAL
jgi:hypothetical protein